MSGNGHPPSTDAQAAGTSAPPPLLPPQPLLRPAPMAAVAAIALGLAVGFAFTAGAPPRSDKAPHQSGERGKVLSVSADQTTGAFRILATEFQNNPGSVLAQLNMPESEKQRLRERLVDGGVRL